MAALLDGGVLVGERWLTDTSAGTLDHVNPATGKVQATFPIGGPTETDAAVAAARQALPHWRALPGAQRRRLLQRVADLLRHNAVDLAETTTAETGMVASNAAAVPQVAADWFDYYAGWADRLSGEVFPVPGSFDVAIREPVGVVAAVITWNGPLGSIGMKLAPALAAGCTVVLKPPELAPFTASAFARLALEAGLPPGVINVVPGAADAGEALVRSPGVDKITFTGGPETARRIQRAAADALTPLVLELGGKSANLVFADADVDAAIAAASAGIVRLNGQACHAPTRLLVERSIYDDVVSAIGRRLEATRVGDPTDPASELGPVISAASCSRILNAVLGSVADGSARLVAGGRRMAGELSDGFYLAPTLLGDVPAGSSVARTELFGPVLVAAPFDDEDDAVRQANATPYALAAYIHTTNLARVLRLVPRLEAGAIAVNGASPNAGPYAPFGGFGESGYGKEGGLDGLLEFTRLKNVNIRLG